MTRLCIVDGEDPPFLKGRVENCGSKTAQISRKLPNIFVWKLSAFKLGFSSCIFALTTVENYF